MSDSLNVPQRLKFALLAEGLRLTPRAREALGRIVTDGRLTPADYASTSGVILRLEDDVWVNAPIPDHNDNFVSDRTPFVLDHDTDGFLVDGGGLSSAAQFWPGPDYHGTVNEHGPLNNYVFSHADRVRLSPIRGCSMTCQFCNIPYDDPLDVYALKPIEASIAGIRTALDDRGQPASHILISGGTPKPKDADFQRELYRRVLAAFPGVDIDIMMVPAYGVLDIPELAALGVRELSINIEIYNRDRARALMRQKYTLGLAFYLDVIARASDLLGPGRVRSMLMVGLEPVEDTLAGVRAIAERGAVPVLSPFRPDPATPMRDVPPATAAELREVFLAAREIAGEFGTELGPSCPPCSHNTLNFARDGANRIGYPHPVPRLV